MSTSPLAKLQRLLQQQNSSIATLTALPFETLFVVASFLGPRDALALGVGMCSRELLGSCALWQQIARNVDPILDEVFVSLTTKPTVVGGIPVASLPGFDGWNVFRDDSSSGTKGTTTTSQNTTLTQTLITDFPNRFGMSERSKAALWRRCALSRDSSLRKALWSRDCGTKGKNLPTRVKPLRAYSFLLDMEKVGLYGNESKKCSVFLENIENDYEEGDEVYDRFLKFKIPDKFLADFFPWGEDIPNEGFGLPIPCLLATTFTVYAIDRYSGKQAKIYSSGITASLNLGYWEFPRQDCGAPTKYPAPHLQGFIHDPWKYGEFSGLENKTFDLCLSLRTGHGAFRYDVTIENLLVFLQREPIYV